MKILLLLALTATLAIAKPGGHYHEEHQSYAQSSAFTNNELQHKIEDEDFYSKSGDLEGRVKPKVNSLHQHNEYVNPKLRNYNQGSGFTSSSGPSYLDDGSSGSSFGASHLGYNHGYSSQNYALSQAQLRQSAQSVQNELQHELNRALANYQRRVQSLGLNGNAQAQEDLRDLETELRRNVTTKFQSLRTYSTSQGQVQPTASYNQELEDLTRQTQNDLLRQLSEGAVNRVVPLRVPVQPVHVPDNSQAEPVRTKTYAHRPERLYNAQPVYVPEPSQYQPVYVSVPVHNPQPSMDSVLQTATNVQNNLNEHLNIVLENTKQRYLQGNTEHSQTFLNQLLAQLQDEVRQNVTEQLRDEFRRVYGYNQRIDNFDDLRRQIENNLITKLTRDFNKQKEFYISQQQSNYQSYVNTNNIEVERLKQRVQDQLQRQLQTALSQQHQTNNYQATLQELREELNQNLTQQLNNYRNQYGNINDAELITVKNQLQDDLQRQLQQGLQGSWSRYSSWSKKSSWSYTPDQPGDGTLNLDDVKSQLQQQMQRQVQSAVDDQRRNAYSSSYQTTLQQLQNELAQNLNTIKSQYRGNNAQLESLQNQLQDDLRNQLQRSWSTSSSYSGSASYSSNGGSSSAGINQIKRQLENQFQNQIQSAVHQQKNSGYHQASLRELSDELNQNLTRQLEQLRSQSQYYGRGYDSEFANLQNQLQGDLQRQLQQSYSSYSSSRYSSQSASGSRSARGGYGYGGVSSSLTAADCDEDDQQHTIYKRSAKETRAEIFKRLKLLF